MVWCQIGIHHFMLCKREESLANVGSIKKTPQKRETRLTGTYLNKVPKVHHQTAPGAAAATASGAAGR